MTLWSIVRLASACLLPIAALEAGAQHFGEVGPLGPMHTAVLTESIGLHYPSRCHRNHLGQLYADRHDAFATICTDAWGTIEPTSLRALTADKAPAGTPYILACGGSTTEMFAAEAEDRWPAHLSRLLAVPAINAAAPAKAMAKCAQTLDYLLERVPGGRQPLILISTSVNTLGTFIAARFQGWSGGALPDQPYAPLVLHRHIRAWIPGLYHLAALTVSAMDQPPSPGQRLAEQLAENCCHIPGDANRRPGLRFDWRAEENRELYTRFAAESLGRIDSVLMRHRVPRGRVLFIVEANSYRHESMPHLARDTRQPLRGLDGDRLPHATAAALTQAYDDIYARVVGERYDVVRADRFGLPASAFFDAVHMTAGGGRAMADHLAPLVKAKLPTP